MSGKKASGKSSTSKGERNCLNKKLANAIRKDTFLGKEMMDKQTAWMNGSNPWITIDNPNKEQTNMKKIRVRMNDMMGSSYKERAKKIFGMKEAQ
jgi:hypothetical protein